MFSVRQSEKFVSIKNFTHNVAFLARAMTRTVDMQAALLPVMRIPREHEHLGERGFPVCGSAQPSQLSVGSRPDDPRMGALSAAVDPFYGAPGLHPASCLEASRLKAEHALLRMSLCRSLP